MWLHIRIFHLMSGMGPKEDPESAHNILLILSCLKAMSGRAI